MLSEDVAVPPDPPDSDVEPAAGPPESSALESALLEPAATAGVEPLATLDDELPALSDPQPVKSNVAVSGPAIQPARRVLMRA
jgi:hypothetical protein